MGKGPSTALTTTGDDDDDVIAAAAFVVDDDLGVDSAIFLVVAGVSVGVLVCVVCVLCARERT